MQYQSDVSSDWLKSSWLSLLVWPGACKTYISQTHKTILTVPQCDQRSSDQKIESKVNEFPITRRLAQGEMASFGYTFKRLLCYNKLFTGVISLCIGAYFEQTTPGRTTPGQLNAQLFNWDEITHQDMGEGEGILPIMRVLTRRTTHHNRVLEQEIQTL